MIGYEQIRDFRTAINDSNWSDPVHLVLAQDKTGEWFEVTVDNKAVFCTMKLVWDKDLNYETEQVELLCCDHDPWEEHIPYYGQGALHECRVVRRGEIRQAAEAFIFDTFPGIEEFD